MKFRGFFSGVAAKSQRIRESRLAAKIKREFVKGKPDFVTNYTVVNSIIRSTLALVRRSLTVDQSLGVMGGLAQYVFLFRHPGTTACARRGKSRRQNAQRRASHRGNSHRLSLYKLHCNYYESRAEMYRTNQNRDSLGWKVLISMAKVREFAPHSSHRAHGDFLVGS